ncbi:MAG: WbqC family protein [Paucibacter sp.]|nr:WbqC family protein [Roseateles sp.]
MKKVVILQSNYIPWKGYFDLIHDADLFVFYDDLQFTKNDWRNRNKIKSPQGTQWLSIPVGTDKHRLICEVQLHDHSWQRIHWETIRQQYGKCKYFSKYQHFFEKIYLQTDWDNLSSLNQHLIKSIASEILGVTTKFSDSRIFELTGQKQDRLLDLVKKTQANQYISGPAAKSYIAESEFDVLGVNLVWKDYTGYPEYSQKHPPFEHGVSILDLIFNEGPNSPWYIWGWREGPLQQ